MKFYTNLLITLILLLSLFETLSACTCSEGGVPTCAEFDRADAVFVGKIEQITAFTAEDAEVSFPSVNSITTFEGSGLVWLNVKIEKAFKGVEGKTVKLTTYQGTSCDIGKVKKGQRWIFFAYRNEESGILGVGACNATGRLSGKLSEYAEYFQELDELSQGKSGTHIKGTLVKDTFVDERQEGKVTVEGESFTATNPTDKAGFFSFKVPKAGKYKVKISVPFSAVFGFTHQFTNFTKNSPTENETVFEYEIDAIENSCNYNQIELRPIDLKATAQISGKYVPKDWKVFSKFYPSLCGLKETEEETLKNCYTDYGLQMDGSFQITGLREGKYTLVINDDNFPDGSAPFWRYYYPGVKDFKEAQPINLEQGQKLSDITFNLPEFLPLREVKGQVFWKDGKPVTFVDGSDNELDIDLYSFEKPNKMIFMDSFLVDWNKEREGKSIEMVEVNADGSFLIRAFDGFTYWLQAEIDLPNDKTKCGFYKLEMKESLIQPIKVVLDRTDKCNTEEYVKELEKKSK